MMWYWSGGAMHWWGWFIGFVITVGFWALIILLVFSFIRSISARDHDHGLLGGEDPEHTLARRFANGEIDEEEFHRRLDTLRTHGLAGKR